MCSDAVLINGRLRSEMLSNQQPLSVSGRCGHLAGGSHKLARAVRMLRSDDPGERSIGAKDLQHLVLVNSLRPKEVDAVIPDLLTALRDQQPAVRTPAAVFALRDRLRMRAALRCRFRELRSIAAGLAEALRDTESEVRRLSALALANLWFTYSRSGARDAAAGGS